MGHERDAVSADIVAAAERFCAVSNVAPTTKRLLIEYLGYPGANGKTLSGQFGPSARPDPAAAAAPADIRGITLRFVGFHIIKHYFKMRQYNEAAGVVLDFLKFLRSEATLPQAFAAQLDAAIKVAEAAVEELPHVMRIIRHPDARNEAFTCRYPLRPYPNCLTPPHSVVTESSSRAWPADDEQQYRSWVSFASERCRLEPEEMEAVLAEVPKGLSIVSKTEGCWEVAAVRADHVLVFKQLFGSKQVEVPFTAKRAADYRRGMVIACTFVGLSDGSLFMTDCGYVFPSFYAPAIRSADDFGPFDEVELVTLCAEPVA